MRAIVPAACITVLAAFLLLAAPPRAEGQNINSAIGKQLFFRMTKPTLKVTGRQEATTVALSGNGKHLVIALASQKLGLWDLDRGREIARLPSARPVTAVSVGDDGKVLAAFDDGSLNLVTADGSRRIAPPGRPVTALAMADTPDFAAVARNDGAVEIYRLSNGQRTFQQAAPSPLIALSFSGPQVRGLGRSGELLTLNAATTAPAAISGKVNGLANISRAGIAADGASGFALAADGTLLQLNLQANSSSRLSARFRDATQVVAAGRPGMALMLERGDVKLFNPTSGKLSATLQITAGGWAVLDYEGRYDGSNDAISNIVWQVGPQNINLDQFAEAYFEPGVLGKYWRGEGGKLAGVPTQIDEGIYPAPTVEVVLDASVPKRAGQAYQLVVLATDGGGGIDGVRLYHNGRLVPPGAMVQAQDVTARDGRKVRAVAYSVTPAGGLNTFSATATTRFAIEGRSERISASFEGSSGPVTQHVLIAGVDDYTGPLPDLNFAVADARGIAEFFRGQAGRSVARRNVRLLTNGEATKAAISAALRGMVAESQPQDIIVLYLAGHGFSPSGDEWRYAPSGAGISGAQLAASTLSASEIETLLAPAAARRILLMIDACQSTAAFGAFVDQRNFYQRFFADMSRTQGLGVLSAARANADATELRQFGHGAFTYVVLNGLKGAADKQPRDSQVSVTELSGYLEAELPDLAFKYDNLRQEPGAFSVGADFFIN